MSADPWQPSSPHPPTAHTPPRPYPLAAAFRQVKVAPRFGVDTTVHTRAAAAPGTTHITVTITATAEMPRKYRP